MSFHIETAGKPADVIREIETKATDLGSPQLNAVAELVCSELETLPADYAGVYAKLAGHRAAGNLGLNIEIRYLPVAVPGQEE